MRIARVGLRRGWKTTHYELSYSELRYPFTVFKLFLFVLVSFLLFGSALVGKTTAWPLHEASIIHPILRPLSSVLSDILGPSRPHAFERILPACAEGGHSLITVAHASKNSRR